MSELTETAPAPVLLAFLTASRKGTSFPIDTPGQYRFGRDPECEVHLPESNVSRVHARATWDGTTLTMEDQKSTNGVFVNGERIAAPVVLRDGDVVAVGPCVFRASLSGQPGGAAGPGPEKPDEQAAQFQRLFECMVVIQRILGEDAEQMVERCVDTLFLALPVTRLCLLRVKGAGELEPWLTRTKSGITRDFVMSRTFARKVREAGKGILIHDALHLDSKEWGHTMQQQEVRSILGVPVFDKGTMVAILLCDNLETPNILRDMHVRTLEFFAQALETVFQRQRIRALESSQAAAERQFLAARRVQKQIFTKKPGARMGGLNWAFHYQPALQVGGDFYDFQEQQGALTWVVADVTGKGISAALVVSMLKGLCKTLFPANPGPREMMLALNKLILDELPPEMFLTALILRIAPDGAATFANAGHLPLLLVRRGAAAGVDAVVRLKPSGVPLGFLGGAEFEDKMREETCRLEPGDRVALFTDGVTEAANAAGEFFGEKRFLSELAGARDVPVEQAKDRVVAALEGFQGAAPQHDDITIVLGEFTPA